MPDIFTEEYTTDEKGGETVVWQYSSGYGSGGMIFHTDPETHKTTEYFVRGLYAPKRLKFLAEQSRDLIYNMLVSGQLALYAEKFEDETGEKVMDLFAELKESNFEYQQAQSVGNFELALKLANNIMETARQTIINDYVYNL